MVSFSPLSLNLTRPRKVLWDSGGTKLDNYGKFEISDTQKLPYVTYLAYKYEVNLKKKHEIRAK